MHNNDSIINIITINETDADMIVGDEENVWMENSKDNYILYYG